MLDFRCSVSQKSTSKIPKKKCFLKNLKIWVFSRFLKDNQNKFRERPGFAGSLQSTRVTQTLRNVTHNADSAESFPPPKIIWYRNNIVLEKTGRILSVENVSIADNGVEYSCLAENKISSGSKHFEIVVEYLPKVKSGRLDEDFTAVKAWQQKCGGKQQQKWQKITETDKNLLISFFRCMLCYHHAKHPVNHVERQKTDVIVQPKK